MVNDDSRVEPKIGDNNPKLNLEEPKEKRNTINSVLTGVALVVALGLGTYNAYVSRSLGDKNNDILLKLEKNDESFIEINSKLKGLESELTKQNSLLIGSSLGYSVQLDLNGDSDLDKITPLSSGNSKVQYAIDKTYSQEYLKTYSYIEDIISDYILGTNKKIPFEHVKEIYKENPLLLCDAKKIAKSLGIWPENGVIAARYEQNYKQLDIELGRINCNPK